MTKLAGITPTDQNNIPVLSGEAPSSTAGASKPASLRMVNTALDGDNNLYGDLSVYTQPIYRATYTYAISATAPYATPTDWVVIRGSATKTVKIVRIELSGAATAATEVLFTLKKHTIANTSGTSTTPTPMQHDSNDAAASATVLLYSVAPTIDASATIWKNVRMTLAVAPAATANLTDRYVYDFGAEPYEPLILRGVAQEFAINFGSVAVPSGGVYDLAVSFSEE